MDRVIQVMTTTDSADVAAQISSALVEKRLAACVQVVGPISSTYRWKGTVETSREWLCLVKTREELYPQVESAIRDVHPYEVPEILAVPIVAGSPAYLDWFRQEAQPGK
jgi:periplasmic divalent cation tolerance protein